jgi:hypothetical protein
MPFVSNHESREAGIGREVEWQGGKLVWAASSFGEP